jgi:hypothetical protein
VQARGHRRFVLVVACSNKLCKPFQQLNWRYLLLALVLTCFSLRQFGVLSQDMLRRCAVLCRQVAAQGADALEQQNLDLAAEVARVETLTAEVSRHSLWSSARLWLDTSIHK